MTLTHTQARILVVEDEAIVARDVLAQLEELGYTPVGHATRGDEAVRLASELRPDLVLMDIALDGPMDGIEAAEILRTQFAPPVVFLTAFDADDTLARAKLTEPYGYLLKPFSERELRTALEMALYKYQVQIKLRESALRTQAILDNMLDGVITLSAQGLIESANPSACAMFGYAEPNLVGQNIWQLMNPAQRRGHLDFLQHYQSRIETSIVCPLREVTGRRQDGSAFPLSLSVTQISRAGQITFIVITRDLSQQHDNAEEIHRLSFYDRLTELPNRRLLRDHVQQAVLNSGRSGQHGALLLLDLDHFKQLNDTLGLDVGDLLLQQVAARLRAAVRESDRVAHLGGDEFVVLLEALSAQAIEAATQAEVTANKILQLLAQPYNLREHTCYSTPSLGIVVFQGAGESPDDLLKKADIAMYEAKNAGRNTLRFFDVAMQAAVIDHAERAADLKRALADQEFILHYQIQVNASGALIGAEALVRWQHPTRGMVSPLEFIALAEETKLILPLGQWVLESACSQLRRWATAPHTAHWTVAVNVSAVQFAQADFVASVAAAVQKSGANPCLLKLELTESLLVHDVQDVIAKMTAIKAQGVGFSLDDFGTGYSSLTYLKRMPLDQLKIDQSFVHDLMTDPNDAAIARAIVALGHSLGLKVIAEGVETMEQRDLLASIDCDAFQGYYFGRPVAADALTA